MTDPTKRFQESSSTYLVRDREDREELTRLEIQDRMMTAGMGGVLPELADPHQLRRVLDVGCATGDWLMETARIYPTIERLVGVDISHKMTTYANAKAESLALTDRVQFQTMDVLMLLDFSDGSFDLVNQRFGFSWLRTWEWAKILREYHRVTQLGGIVRITETNVRSECNSPALTKLCDMALEAYYHSGRLFTAGGDGVISQLPHLLTQYGMRDVQTRMHTIVYRAGTEAGRYFYEDMQRAFRVLIPFLEKWVHVPRNYDEIYQQALKEMQQPDFVATWTLLTAWGTKPIR